MSQPSAEAREAIARFQLQATLAALDPVDRALALIPDDRLAERPVEMQLPVGALIAHIYQAAAMCARATRLGRMTASDMEGIGEPEKASGRADIEAIGVTARAEIATAIDAMTADTADRVIEFYFGISATGLEAASIGYSELVHHRGQVTSFLRMMGLEPPSIYEGH